MKKILILVFLFCQLTTAYSELRFKKLSIEDGLSQSTVETILQDRTGFLWVGTEDGLNRYDGYRFRIFKHDPDDSTSISNNNIWCLQEDQNGYIWIGTFSGGLNRYDPDTETFQRFLYDPTDVSGLVSNNIRAICLDSRGYLWIGTRDKGISCLNTVTLKFENLLKNPAVHNILAGTNIRNITVDADENLWFATNKGLFNYDPQSGEFIRVGNQEKPFAGLSNQSIRHVFQDRSGIFWISTTDGLNSYDRETRKIVNYLQNDDAGSIPINSVRSAFEDSRGRLWVLVQKYGIMILNLSDNSTQSITHDDLDPHSLSNNSVRCIYEDRSGLIWIGTMGGGLNMFDPGTERFHQYRSVKDNPNSLSHSIIWSILEDSDGDLWFATNNGGLNRFDRKTQKYIHYKHNPLQPHSISTNDLRFVMQDHRSNIWIATQNTGINRLDKKSGKFTRFRHNVKDSRSLASDNVRFIYEDRNGNLWIGTWGGGLDLYDSQTESFHHFPHQPENDNSLSGNNVIAIYQATDSVYWVATTNGLNRIIFPSAKPREINNGSVDPQFTRYFHKTSDLNSISNNYVLSIHEAKNGDLWFGTMLGLNRLEKKHRNQPFFKRYLIKDGLPNDIIYGILEDGEGHIWSSTNNGLFHLNLENGRIKTYDMRDGLHSNEFNTGAYFKTQQGGMLFGGVDGATEFYPDSLYDSPYEAPVVLTGFSIFDRPAKLDRTINNTEEITLSYQDNYFSFDFAALDFAKPERNRYAYILEGLDRDWISAGTRRFAGYTQLDAGNYLFKVKGTNGDGVWNENAASVRIIITPPFWKTWWFITIMVLSTASGIALLITYRVKQLLAIERLRSKIAADLHDDIGAGLTEISILGEVIAQKLAGPARPMVNSELQKINTTARGLIDSMSHIVWLVNPRRDSLYDLISRLGDSYKELLDSTDIQFKTQNLDSLKKVHLKMEHRQHLFLIFHEAINNSVKYSQGTEISLNASLKGKKLTLQLTDNGRGFDVTSVRAGNGLKNMTDRAHVIGGELSIISNPETGTEIRFEGNLG